MNISLVVSTRNNLKYLKWSYDSIRKNQGNHDVWICYGIDHCTDGTQEWITEIQQTDPKVKSIENTTGCRVGHTIMYDRIINEIVDTDLAMIFHSDMYLCPGALDAIDELMYTQPEHYKSFEFLGTTPYRNRIVSLTRIEPPLHPPGPEKIVKNFGMEPDEFDSIQLDMFVTRFMHEIKMFGHKVDKNLDVNFCSNGVFAPWCFWVDEFKEIGGHDPLYAPQSKEDSDFFNRFKLKFGEDCFKQTWNGFVYHLTCRGSRFNPNITNVGHNSSEWETQNIRSTKNFIRKWGSMVQHDAFLHPIIPPKYKTVFKIRKANPALIEWLEPWADYIDCDLDVALIDEYIAREQPNTSFDLEIKFYGLPDVQGIVVEIDGDTFNLADMKNLQQLSQIIEQDEQLGQFTLGNLKITINDLTHYEKDLIVCK